jgi:hypothetical protein
MMNQQQQAARDRAVQVLHHYIERTLALAGGKPDADTRAEVEGIVDDIILAAGGGKTEHEKGVEELRREASPEMLEELRAKVNARRAGVQEVSVEDLAPIDPRD